MTSPMAVCVETERGDRVLVRNTVFRLVTFYISALRMESTWEGGFCRKGRWSGRSLDIRAM